jgi:hypothetical protein
MEAVEETMKDLNIKPKKVVKKKWLSATTS